MTADSILLREDRDGVATLTMNRPAQRNALSMALMAEMIGALEAIHGDPNVKAVVIAGAGPAFCAGHDLKEIRANPGREIYEALFSRCSQLMLTVTRLRQPVIARVHGIATAAGCQLAAQCDLAVAANNARFAVSGVNLGLFCSTPAVALSRNVGRKRAAEMLLTGDFIDAATAEEWGLVNRVCPPERLMETVDELANNLKAKPREVLALGKSLFYRQLEAGLADAYRDASRTISCNMVAPVAQEGVDAFLQKRPPSWKG